MRVAVLSGKGGTGKTFLSVNLAVAAEHGSYLDCDVEEPNGRLFLRPHIVWAEGAGEETAAALEEAGWACFTADVDGRDDGRGQSAQRVSLMTGLDGWQGRVNVLLDDSAAVAGYLSQALGQMLREGYTFRQPLESEL